MAKKKLFQDRVTDQDLTGQVDLRTRLKYRLYCFQGGVVQANKTRVRSDVAVRMALQGGTVMHVEWQEAKKLAEREGVNTREFGKGLGKQYDGLMQTLTNAFYIVQSYGGVSKEGLRSVKERVARLKRTLEDYIRLCAIRGTREKARPPREQRGWVFLKGVLENHMKFLDKEVGPKVSELTG